MAWILQYFKNLIGESTDFNENCGIMNLRVPRITHTELSYDKALLPEARVTGLILNDITVRKTQDAGY